MASTYTVERTTKINASPEVIFDRISNFRRWPDWSPWEELDPDMTKTYTGADGEVGSHYAWNGNRRAGAGSMTITGLDGPRSMTSDLNFTRPFKSASTMGLALTPQGQSTVVDWTMTAPHNLITRVMNVFGLMDKQIGKDFEKGLAKLKSLSEN
jgi:hypothetical protein